MHFMWCLLPCLLLMSRILLPVSGVCRPDDRFNKFGRKACGDGFCFDVALTLIVTGPFEPIRIESGDAILDHYAKVGFDMSEIITEGKAAIDFFLTKYGIDFSGLSDNDVLRGINTDSATNATFFPFVIDSDETFRLYQVATRCGFDFLNVPVKEAGWMVVFPDEFTPSGGTFTETIPAGSLVEFGSFIIDVCGHKDHPDRFCPSILRSDRSRSPLFIRFSSRTYLTLSPPFTEPFFPVNCDVHSDDFGDGAIRGALFLAGTRPSDDRAVVDGKLILTFPATRSLSP